MSLQREQKRADELVAAWEAFDAGDEAAYRDSGLEAAEAAIDEAHVAQTPCSPK